MRDYRRSPALAMVAPMIGLCFHKLISRPSLRPAHPIVAAFLFLNFSIVPAQADYERAKMHFDNLDAVTQSWIGLGLIATGDFDGLTEFGFTKRFYNAVTAFQMREGFVPDGELDTGELTQLKEKWAEFYDSLAGVITATGIDKNTGSRKPIQAHEWQDLKLTEERDQEALVFSRGPMTGTIAYRLPTMTRNEVLREWPMI